MKRILIIVALLCLAAYAAYGQSAILGKSDLGVVRLTTLSGAVLDSARATGTSDDFTYDVTVLSKSGIWSKVQFKDIVKQTVRTYSVRDTSARTDIIPNFRLRFKNTLTVGSMARVQYTHYPIVTVDSTGALRQALWNTARTDSLQNLKATARTILLNNDYPRGLTVIANVNLQFRTNRITNWIFLFAGGSIYIPIRHTAADTFYAKTATIPDICIVRGK
ncbi:MAG TPA: hypothetical protein PKZ83_16845 [bacterium]|nr:hypothetical protein [bacterium]HQJ66300.1 hypothetical protein [bacterium]